MSLGTVNKTETQYNFGKSYLVSVDGVFILDYANERVGVLIGEYNDLEQAYMEVCDKRDQYKEMLIENNIIEREYTKEELAEIQYQQDRERMNELTEAVKLLLEKSKVDSDKIENLTKQLSVEQDKKPFEQEKKQNNYKPNPQQKSLEKEKNNTQKEVAE